MERVLIVEDDMAISDMLSMNLTVAGYDCTCAYTGSEALSYIEKDIFNLILLDVMLPEIDGFTLMPSIQKKEIPVIYLTAKNALEDKIRGLRLGAEDYIVKPFEILELIVRMEKVLQRSTPKKQKLSFLDVEMDVENRSVFQNGKEILLAPMEYDLLKTFLEHPKMTHTRERLLNQVWGEDFFGETRTLDVHIAYLRKKLQWGHIITTVHKVGYRLEENL